MFYSFGILESAELDSENIASTSTAISATLCGTMSKYVHLARGHAIDVVTGDRIDRLDCDAQERSRPRL